jgi:hypothetical protein
MSLEQGSDNVGFAARALLTQFGLRLRKGGKTADLEFDNSVSTAPIQQFRDTVAINRTIGDY